MPFTFNCEIRTPMGLNACCLLFAGRTQLMPFQVILGEKSFALTREVLCGSGRKGVGFLSRTFSTDMVSHLYPGLKPTATQLMPFQGMWAKNLSPLRERSYMARAEKRAGCDALLQMFVTCDMIYPI